jgi:hypothetical protein
MFFTDDVQADYERMKARGAEFTIVWIRPAVTSFGIFQRVFGRNGFLNRNLPQRIGRLNTDTCQEPHTTRHAFLRTVGAANSRRRCTLCQ